MSLEILPLTGIGEVRAGDDLAALTLSRGIDLRDGDILVVSSKIVSKAEGRVMTAPLASRKILSWMISWITISMGFFVCSSTNCFAPRFRATMRF